MSVTIINQTEGRAPKAQFAPRPNLDTLSKLERERWVNKELEKYIFGTDANGEKIMSQSDEIGSGLTGLHYFVLNSGIYYTDPKGKPTKPRWRYDDEDLIFNPIELCDRKIAKGDGDYDDLVIIKRRRYGLSTTFFGAYAIYNLITQPGSVYGVTSADWRRIGDGFQHKLNPMWLNFNSDLKPRAKSPKGGVVVSQAGARLDVEYKERNEEGEYRSGYVVGVETAKNPKNMEGFTLFRAFLDEIALHPFAKKVRASCNAALSDDLFRIGYMIMGGTVGEMTIEGANELKQLVDSRVVKDEFGNEKIVGAPHIIYSLVMGYHAVKQFTVNGWTDHEAAKQWILRERESLNKNPDKTDLEKFITDYPLTKEEMFDVSGQSTLPVQLREPHRIQLSKAIAAEPLGKWGYMHRDSDGQVLFTEHKDGKIWLRGEPDRTHEFGFGTDPIPFESDDDEEGSENAMIGEDLTTGKIMVTYLERSADPDMIVDNCIMIQDYFGNGKNMIEKNRGGVLMRTYKLKGREDLMAKKPKIGENQKWGDLRDRYGWHKAMNSEYAYSLQVSTWNKKIYEIDVQHYLEGMRYWRSKRKPDLIDASVSLEVLKEDLRERKKKEDYEQPEFTRVRTIKNGKYVYVDIPLKGQPIRSGI